MSTLYALVKIFTEQAHADAFRRGQLFMRPLSYFREFKDEHGELRGDRYEGIGALFQPDQLSEIRIGSVSIKPEDLGGPIFLQPLNIADAHLFCMYSLNSRGFDQVSAENLRDLKEALAIHESIFGFGGIACAVPVRAFLDRVVIAAAKNGFPLEMRLVEYFDETQHHGTFENPGFHKKKSYEKQREYRIMVSLPEQTSEPYILDVGDLADIARIMTVEELNRTLEISLPDGTRV